MSMQMQARLQVLLKAAIRYLRYIDDLTPGDAKKIFVFGMSGGGAQSALVGATGDSALYDPYLGQIDAVQGVSDAVYGSMDWCPITNLDSADEAYEWMMGVTRSGLSDEETVILAGPTGMVTLQAVEETVTLQDWTETADLAGRKA